jgi:predicted lipoprotein
MRRAALAAFLCLSGPALADVDAALDAQILPGFAAFAAAAQAADGAAQADCRAPAVAPAYHAAFDAWMRVGDLRLGPSETGALSVAFWPDARGATPRALARLIAEADPVARDPAAYAEVSIAARGLLALDMLLFDPAFRDYGADSYPCALVRAVAADLARQATGLDAAWRDGFAAALRTAGAPANATFLSEEEAVRALYTQILTSLEFTAEQRLGRPMGDLARPQPARAEAWRSGRSLRNVTLAAEAAHAMAHALADWDLPQTDAAAGRVRAAAARIADPAFQDMAEPQARLRAAALQQAVRAMRAALAAEIGARLGIAAGFNAQDGD